MRYKMNKFSDEHDLELLHEMRKEILSDEEVCTCSRDRIFDKIIEVDIECPIHGFDEDDRDWYRTRDDNRTAGYPI